VRLNANGTSDRSHGAGRLSIALLLATAAAFLLVPAAQAFANGTMTVVASGAGSGEVESVGGNALGFFEGTPPLQCHWNGTEFNRGTSPSEGSNVSGLNECENELEVGGGGETTFMRAHPDWGSEFGGWEILEGGLAAVGCKAGDFECAPIAEEGSNAALEVEAIFLPCATLPNEPGEPTCENPELKLTIEGSGEGEVVGKAFFGVGEGQPKMECSYDGSSQSGTCKNHFVAENAAKEEGWTSDRFNNLKVEPAAGSEFAGWTIVEHGGHSLANCADLETAENCLFTLTEKEWKTEGYDVEVIATFEAPPPPLKLNLTTSGSGSGSFECDTGSGAEACQAEYPEGTEVTITAVPNTGSEFVEFNAENGGECAGASCTVTMSGPRSVNAQFDLETFELTLTAIGEGTLLAECGGGACASLTEIPYGTEVDVTAAPNSIEYVLASITGGGSAAGNCSLGSETCSFTMGETSSVEAEFVLGNGQDVKFSNVHGEVPQTTTLESECGDVNLGTFEPNAQEDKTYAKQCGLIVTSTGAATSLTAADESEEAVGRLGHLVQPSYALAEPLETMATDNDGLGGTSGTGGELAPLTSPVTLLTWGVPVNFDHLTLEFSQLINQHDPLHTGEYSKTITLTLKQTA